MARPIGSIVPTEDLIARLPFDINDAIKRYQSGEGLEPLAFSLGTSYNRLRHVFVRLGIPLRNKSDAMRTRLKMAGRKGRLALTAAAHEANKGRKRPPDEDLRIRINAARSKEISKAFIGKHEKKLASMLIKRGCDPIPQKAVHSYNIDIAIFPVAVEVHTATNHPMNVPKLRKRIKKLVKSGWWVIYVRPTRTKPLTETAADEVLTFFKKAKRNPTRRGKYRVIWGSGERSPRGSRKSDKRS